MTPGLWKAKMSGVQDLASLRLNEPKLSSGLGEDLLADLCMATHDDPFVFAEGTRLL